MFWRDIYSINCIVATTCKLYLLINQSQHFYQIYNIYFGFTLHPDLYILTHDTEIFLDSFYYFGRNSSHLAMKNCLIKHLKTRYNFYLLTPFYIFYFIEHDLYTATTNRPCDLLISEHLLHVIKC